MMRVFAAACAAALPAALAAPALAAPALAADPPDAACRTGVTLSPDGERLSAQYRLCAPVAEFVFGRANVEQRRDSWSADSGWSFDGQTLSRLDGAPFDGFTLGLEIDARFYDRAYVAIDRIGAGWTVLTSAFPYRGEPAELRFQGFGADAIVHGLGESVPADQAVIDATPGEQALVYVGPADAVHPGAITVIAGAEVPQWLRDRLIAGANAAVERFTVRFGETLPRQPTLMISYRQEGDGLTTKGSVLDGQVVEIRLRGVIDPQDPSRLDGLANTITHEAAHFWIGRLWRSARNAEEPWLHEGAAEYVASRVRQGSESLRRESQQRINACLLRNDTRPLDGSEGALAGQAPYDCGFAMMLVAEAASVRAGASDIFDLWRAVAAKAGADGFLPADFLTEATARGGEPFAAFAREMLGVTSEMDRQAMADALQAIGLDAALLPAAEVDAPMARGAALNAVLAAHCEGSHGFSSFEDRLVLDTGDRCGDALNGDPAIVSVNGADLIGDVPAAHAAIGEACARGEDLVFAGPDGATLPPVACTVAIAPLPPLLAIGALPDLPAP